MAAELIVDSQIRWWVFLPIVMITFLVGILRHYISNLLTGHRNGNAHQIKDNNILARARLLHENAKYIPKSAFLMRKHAFNKDNDGYLTRRRPPSTQNPITDPTFMTDMLKGNLTNVLPMIVIGGWINWMFSGFITTKVPFPLTLRFKPMLQRGVELLHLDASWVSSASWYFLNVFGLRSLYTLALGENNAADQSKQMQDQMTTSAASNDSKSPFKSEWESLEIMEHRWALEGIERSLMHQK